MEFRSSCPISSALDLIGDKWSLLLLRDLIFFQKHTFSELVNSDEKIATNILSSRLSRLEQMKIIEKRKMPGNKKVNLYLLTSKGADFLPVLAELIVWSDKHLQSHISAEGKQFARMLRKDKVGVLEYRMQKLEQRG